MSWFSNIPLLPGAVNLASRIISPVISYFQGPKAEISEAPRVSPITPIPQGLKVNVLSRVAAKAREKEERERRALEEKQKKLREEQIEAELRRKEAEKAEKALLEKLAAKKLTEKKKQEQQARAEAAIKKAKAVQGKIKADEKKRAEALARSQKEAAERAAAKVTAGKAKAEKAKAKAEEAAKVAKERLKEYKEAEKRYYARRLAKEKARIKTIAQEKLRIRIDRQIAKANAIFAAKAQKAAEEEAERQEGITKAIERAKASRQIKTTHIGAYNLFSPETLVTDAEGNFYLENILAYIQENAENLTYETLGNGTAKAVLLDGVNVIGDNNQFDNALTASDEFRRWAEYMSERGYVVILARGLQAEDLRRLRTVAEEEAYKVVSSRKKVRNPREESELRKLISSGKDPKIEKQVDYFLEHITDKMTTNSSGDLVFNLTDPDKKGKGTIYSEQWGSGASLELGLNICNYLSTDVKVIIYRKSQGGFYRRGTVRKTMLQTYSKENQIILQDFFRLVQIVPDLSNKTLEKLLPCAINSILYGTTKADGTLYYKEYVGTEFTHESPRDDWRRIEAVCTTYMKNGFHLNQTSLIKVVNELKINLILKLYGNCNGQKQQKSRPVVKSEENEATAYIGLVEGHYFPMLPKEFVRNVASILRIDMSPNAGTFSLMTRIHQHPIIEPIPENVMETCFLTLKKDPVDFTHQMTINNHRTNKSLTASSCTIQNSPPFVEHKIEDPGKWFENSRNTLLLLKETQEGNFNEEGVHENFLESMNKSQSPEERLKKFKNYCYSILKRQGPPEFIFDTETWMRPDTGKASTYSASVYDVQEGKAFTKLSMFREGTLQEAAVACINRIAELVHQRILEVVNRVYQDVKGLDIIPSHIAAGLMWKHTPRIGAHNLSFDFGTILASKNLTEITNCFGGLGSLKGGRGKWKYTVRVSNRSFNYEAPLDFFNTYSLIPLPLADFAKAFQLESHKSPFPYSWFNEENTMNLIKAGWSPKACRFDVEEFYPHMKPSEHQEFIEAATKCGALKAGKLNIYEYVKYYNEKDVEVTYLGLKTFREMFLKNLGVDITSCLTIGSAADRTVKEYGCYENVPELHGDLSEFIRTNIRGGYSATFRNKPYRSQSLKEVKAQTPNPTHALDLDINSLYPYCQKLLPAGLPLFILDLQNLPEYAKKYRFIFCHFHILTPNRSPYPSFVPHNMPDGRRVYYDEEGYQGAYPKMVGSYHETTEILKDMGLEHDVDYKISSAILFPGTCDKLGAFTYALYDWRVRVKGANTGLSTVLKYVLNNIWGKCMQRLYGTSVQYFADPVTAFHNLEKKIFTMKSFYLGKENEKSYIEYQKDIFVAPSSRAQVSMVVTERAKVSIFRHIKACVDAGMKFLFLDTDSCHVDGATPGRVEDYRRIYQEYYGNDPLEQREMEVEYYDREAKEVKTKRAKCDILGNMKIDYDVSSAVPKGNKIKELYCDWYAYIQPKTYACRIKVVSEDSAGTETTAYVPHIRSKGISKSAMNHKLLQLRDEDPSLISEEHQDMISLYSQLYTNRVEYLDRLDWAFEDAIQVCKNTEESGQKLSPEEEQDIYRWLAKGYTENTKAIEFDMLAGGSISMEYNTAGSFYKKEFKRCI